MRTQTESARLNLVNLTSVKADLQQEVSGGSCRGPNISPLRRGPKRSAPASATPGGQKGEMIEA